MFEGAVFRHSLAADGGVTIELDPYAVDR
jgi:hypothetical protein